MPGQAVTFQSRTRPGVTYRVTFNNAGAPQCDCPGYTEREGPHGERGCRHVREVMIAQLRSGQRECPECGGPTFYDDGTLKFTPGARVDGKPWSRLCAVAACSRCEWIREV